MLSGPHRKFCEGIIAGLSGVDAYRAAFPKSARSTARQAASRLRKRPGVRDELAELRAKADGLAGSAVLTLIEKRIFLARVVRACIANIPADSDLWQSIKHTEAGTEYRLPDKLRAIAEDNDLAGVGSEAEVNDALGALLERVMK